jgi:O-antigen ligase
MGGWLVGATLAVPPFLFLPQAIDGFRLPQRMAVEWLALASLVALAATAPLGPEGLRALGRQPAARATLPLLALATLSLATTAHPLHVADALVDLTIGVAALVGWSLWLGRERLDPLLDLTLVPAVPLAVLGILQAHRIWTPLGFAVDTGGGRLETTSLAGNPGDLAALLVLPCLLAQARLATSPRRMRWALLAALLVYGIAVTQTLTSLAALAVGSVLLWALLLPRRRVLVAAVVGVVVLAAALAVVPGLRDRVLGWRHQLELGGFNQLLSGRLDGWRVAGELLADHPLTGVGHGAYRAGFGAAKLELVARGETFYLAHVNPSFSNAHNEYLEVAADLGWPGVLVLAWGAWTLAVAAWRHRADDRARGALAWAGLVAVAMLALAYFPFRLGPVAFGWVAFLAWLAAPAAAEGGE